MPISSLLSSPVVPRSGDVVSSETLRRYVYLAYLDDSGSTGRNLADKECPFQIIGALLIGADEFDVTEILLSGIIDEFVRDLPGHVRLLEALLLKQELDPLRRLVHQLRGACGGYGFEPITEVAAAAEDAIKTGQSPQAISTCVNALIHMIQRVKGYSEIAPAMAA